MMGSLIPAALSNSVMHRTLGWSCVHESYSWFGWGCSCKQRELAVTIASERRGWGLYACRPISSSVNCLEHLFACFVFVYFRPSLWPSLPPLSPPFPPQPPTISPSQPPHLPPFVTPLSAFITTHYQPHFPLFIPHQLPPLESYGAFIIPHMSSTSPTLF